MGLLGFLENDVLVMMEFRVKQDMVLVKSLSLVLEKKCFSEINNRELQQD